MNRSPPDPRTVAHSALIDAYMSDLEQALRDAEPSERDEVLMTVRERIAAALQEKAAPITAKDVESVLVGLGSVDQLVGAFDYGAAPVQGVAPRSKPSPRWLAYATLAAGVLPFPLLIFQPLLGIVFAFFALIAGVIGSRDHHGIQKLIFLAAAVLGGLFLIGLLLILVAPFPGPVVEVPAFTTP